MHDVVGARAGQIGKVRYDFVHTWSTTGERVSQLRWEGAYSEENMRKGGKRWE